MNRLTTYTATLMIGVRGMGTVQAGEASTKASAANGWGRNGSAAAVANYTGQGGVGLARTDTSAGDLALARGLAVGFDQNGLDFSFSHAIAPRVGPAYAGTFNLSIGLDGRVSGSYGGVLSTGGLARSAEAGGATSTLWRGGTAQAIATGNAAPGGRVNAYTHSYNQPRQPNRIVRLPFQPLRMR